MKKIDLIQQYIQFLEKFKIEFGKDPVFIASEIKIPIEKSQIINKFGKFFLFTESSIEINYEYQDNYEEIIEFAAILSFLSESYRNNQSIYILLFLLHFKKSKIQIINQIYNAMLLNLKDDFFSTVPLYPSIIEEFIQNNSVKMVITEFIPYLSPNIILEEIMNWINHIYTFLKKKR